MEGGNPNIVQEGLAILRGCTEQHGDLQNLSLPSSLWVALRCTEWLFYFQALPRYFQAGTVVKGEGKSALHQILPAIKELSEAPPSNLYLHLFHQNLP